MSNHDIIRAWKDEEYREEMRNAALPENPAGIIELSEEALREIGGALLGTHADLTAGCCHTITSPACSLVFQC